MSVEGIPQRDQTVTFTKQFASYNAGEVATFTADEAQRLAAQGVTTDAPPPSTDPPANTAVPYAAQAGAEVTCTMGEWTGEPTAYAYQWQSDGTDVGTGTPYPIIAADDGHTFTCVVTATNANGSTAAPPSNAVVVTAAATQDATTDKRKPTK
jgi:hypothetical protein